MLCYSNLELMYNNRRAGYPNAPHDWLRRGDFSTTDMPDDFDIEADRVQAAQQLDHDRIEARKARIESATSKYQDRGMQYSKACDLAQTDEFTREGGMGKRTRNHASS